MTDQQRRPITILTYNVGNGLARPERLAAFLRDSDADVIGLQEIDVAQAAALEEIALESYPHRVIHGAGFDGCALLSKYPITDLDWHDLAIGRRALRATLDIDGKPLRMTVAHPQPPRLRRWGIAFDKTTRQQLDILGQLVSADPHSVLVGDFNMTMRHPIHGEFRQFGLIDAFHTVGKGRGSTFPLRPGHMKSFDHHLYWVPLPAFTRLDYIWHTPDLRTLFSWTERGVGSDHSPVFALLAWGTPPAG